MEAFGGSPGIEFIVQVSVAVGRWTSKIYFMTTKQLQLPIDVFGQPAADEKYRAIVDRDTKYDGLFFYAVKTTGVFCRSGCAARAPLRQNVRFFDTTSDALAAGYRPCKRCQPMDVAGKPPDWLESILHQVEADPSRRWKDQDIRASGVDPTRVSRWFKSNHGITFHAYLRSRRLSTALAQLSIGDDVNQVAYNAGYSSVSGFRDAFQKWFGATPGQASGKLTLLVNRILTPLGPMVVAATQQHLFLLEFADRRMLQTQVARLASRFDCQFSPGQNAVIEQTDREMSEYFNGSRQHFTVALQMPGTEFQQAIWRQLLQIPYGETRSYEQLAVAAGRPGASRAVGRANGDNRLGVIVPCHRVIRSDGTLSGYGGGVRRKEWMLNHERSLSCK